MSKLRSAPDRYSLTSWFLRMPCNPPYKQLCQTTLHCLLKSHGDFHASTSRVFISRSLQILKLEKGSHKQTWNKRKEERIGRKRKFKWFNQIYTVARLFCCFCMEHTHTPFAEVLPLVLFSSQCPESFNQWRVWAIVIDRAQFVSHRETKVVFVELYQRWAQRGGKSKALCKVVCLKFKLSTEDGHQKSKKLKKMIHVIYVQFIATTIICRVLRSKTTMSHRTN